MTIEINLQSAEVSDAELLSNLLELYIHDLSPVFPNLELGPNGRFGYRRLPLYWSEPERRFAFLIKYDGRVAGFVLVTRESPAAEEPAGLDVAEFFVLRRYRRAGVGRRAAFMLWNSLPGAWTVRVLEANSGALLFWSDVIAEYTNGAARESSRPDSEEPWRVFSFQSGSEP